METRTIAILANSVKHHEHCVAGKCIITGKWIRPVSSPQGGELTDDQVRYENNYGTYHVKILQKIEMQLAGHVPLDNQPDNYLISDTRWQQRFKISENDLPNYLDCPDDLWGEDDNIIFDFIENGEIDIDQSLYLVEVDDLELYRTRFHKRRASFTYNNIKYDLAVTDPSFDHLIDNEEELGNILCISLGENYQGRCYKLIATIF